MLFIRASFPPDDNRQHHEPPLLIPLLMPFAQTATNCHLHTHSHLRTYSRPIHSYVVHMRSTQFGWCICAAAVSTPFSFWLPHCRLDDNRSFPPWPVYQSQSPACQQISEHSTTRATHCHLDRYRPRIHPKNICKSRMTDHTRGVTLSL